MARDYAIDTNVYIDALHSRDELRAMKEFLTAAGPHVCIHATVALELRAGARTRDQRDALEDLIAKYVQRGRVIIPSFAANLQAGRVLADIANKEHVALSNAPRSLGNDVLIATSCREENVHLITNNHADFTRIKRHLRGFHFGPPWPRHPSAPTRPSG